MTLQIHGEHVIEGAHFVRFENAVHQLGTHAILKPVSAAVGRALWLEDHGLIALEHMQFKSCFELARGIVLMSQEESDIGIRGFDFDHSDGGVQEVFEIGRADDGLVEVRGKADDVQSVDEFSLFGNEIVTQNINLLRLFLARFIELVYQQAQPFISLFIIGDHESFGIPSNNICGSSYVLHSARCQQVFKVK